MSPGVLEGIRRRNRDTARVPWMGLGDNLHAVEIRAYCILDAARNRANTEQRLSMTKRTGFHVLSHVLCLLPLMSGALGCASAELQATSGHVPVLLGPVACIGCKPGAAGPAQDRPFAAEVATTITGISGQSSSALISSIQGGSFGEVADSSVGDLCTGEIRLDSIKASVFHIESFVYSRASYYVGASGHAVTVPSGVCDPRLYPSVEAPSGRESP